MALPQGYDKEEDSTQQSTVGGFSEYTSDLKTLAGKYMIEAKQVLGSIGSNMIYPSANIATGDTMAQYSRTQMNKLANQEALLFAGLYSMRKTKDPSAFAKALEMKNATMDDIMSMRANAKVINNPNSGRNAKIASAAYLQRYFGIDAAKDYAHLNAAESALDSIKSDIGRTMMGLGETQTAVLNKMKLLGSNAKIPREQYVTSAMVSGTFNAIKELTRLYEEEDDQRLKGEYKSKLEKVKKHYVDLLEMPVSDYDKKENYSDSNGE